ncbi:MAG: putative metal-dependent hydrolase [Parcubacteria group bacterium]|nr:putative metal-dependent hydrolase [Parcubacteria group bacterium]
MRRKKGPTAIYLKHREEARALVKERLEYWNQFYGYTYNRVAIKDHKTRWGSCSKKGNLNFNYRVVFLPPALQDYLIVHELCHLGEFNHSPAFWTLVGKTVPDYEKRRGDLRIFKIPRK